jgi:hypothetical protein
MRVSKRTYQRTEQDNGVFSWKGMDVGRGVIYGA